MLPHNNLPAYLALEKDNICKAYIFAHQKSLLSIFLHNKASVSMGIWHRKRNIITQHIFCTALSSHITMHPLQRVSGAKRENICRTYDVCTSKLFVQNVCTQ